MSPRIAVKLWNAIAAPSLVAAFIGGALLITSHTVQAQAERTDSTAPGIDQPIVRALTRLNPNTQVRVRTASTIIEGSYSGFNEHGLLLQGARIGLPIPLSSIDEMWKRSRSPLQGALIGGAIGGVLVGAFGVLVVAGFCEQPNGCSGDYPTAILFGGAIGAAGGGLIGAGIGSLVKRWERIHP